MIIAVSSSSLGQLSKFDYFPPNCAPPTVVTQAFTSRGSQESTVVADPTVIPWPIWTECLKSKGLGIFSLLTLLIRGQSILWDDQEEWWFQV